MRQRKTDRAEGTDWLLGKAFCHMKTPPPLHPIPVIQALSVKDAQTDRPENLGSRLSQLSSHLIKVFIYASSCPSSFFPSCRMFNTLWNRTLYSGCSKKVFLFQQTKRLIAVNLTKKTKIKEKTYMQIS